MMCRRYLTNTRPHPVNDCASDDLVELCVAALVRMFADAQGRHDPCQRVGILKVQILTLFQTSRIPFSRQNCV